MAEAPRTTTVALPFVSKSGFSHGTTMSLVLSIVAGGMRDCYFLFLGDHTQIGARNHACEWALKKDSEWLFFIDSDMDFPVETLARLKACDADIACTDMWARNVPSFRTVGRLTEPDEDGTNKVEPYAGTGIERIDTCGMACTLIRTKLLREMQEKMGGAPWFQSARHGEDAMFCFLAKDLCDAKIVCDFGITAGHWGVARMAGQEWTRDAANNPMQVADPEFMRRMQARNVKEE